MRAPTVRDQEEWGEKCDLAYEKHVQERLDHPEDFCSCGRELITEAEERNRVCRDCL